MNFTTLAQANNKCWASTERHKTKVVPFEASFWQFVVSRYAHFITLENSRAHKALLHAWIFLFSSKAVNLKVYLNFNKPEIKGGENGEKKF